MKTEICAKCDCIRPITEFTYNSRRKNNGTRTRRKVCRRCVNEHWQLFREQQPDYSIAMEAERELREALIPELMARAKKGLELCER